MKLKNKFAVVTGASTGIGKAIAIELARQGVFVALVSRRKKRLNEIRKNIEDKGGKAKAFVCDLSKTTSINNFLPRIKKQTKSVDIIVNVAGIWHGTDKVYADKDYEKFSQQVILDTFMVGTIAPSLLVHALIPLMPTNGKIVNISGTFENGAKGWLPYFVSKKAIEDLTIGLAQELERKNIQVNAVSPSDTATEQYKKYFPQYIPEAIEPEKIAEQVAFLASDKANKITGKVFVMKKGKKPYEGYHK